MLDAAGVTVGTHLLDVGTGTGTVAALACARGATVVAVDAEPSMLSVARRAVPTAEVHHATLPRLPFTGGRFDAAVANFVLNHVGEPAAAVAELRRVVRPGGRVAVTIWPSPPPVAQGLWGAIFAAAGVEGGADLPRVAPDHDFPRTGAGLGGLLDRAGLADVRCATVAWTHHTDAESWWRGPAGGLGSAGVLLRRQGPDMVARIL